MPATATGWSVTVEGLHEALAKVPDSPRVRAATLRILKRCGLRIVREAQLLAPQRQRQLMRSIKIISTNDAEPSIRVGSVLRYAKGVEEGTGIWGPHATEIVPVQAQALHWRGGKYGAGDHFAKSVAGQPGRHFMRDGILRARAGMGEEVRAGVQGLFSAH